MSTPVTLKQIANRADVSEMTVSKVLSGRYQPTQRRAVARANRIREIAQKMGYRPNAAAKAIRLGRFGAMALLMSVKPHRGALFTDMLMSMHDTLAEHDLKLTLARMTDEQLTDDTQLPKLLNEWCCDGMLVNYTDDVPEKMVDLINAHHLPAVWVNTMREYDCVRIDDVTASRQATEALLAAGHTRIAYVDYTHGPASINPHYSAKARLEGYRQAMSQAGLQPREELTQTGEGVPRPDRVGFVMQWLDSPDRPTAVLCYGQEEVLPIGFAAMSKGLVIPRDLSMVSFGEISLESMGPRLATMLLPTFEMGQQAVEMLIKKVAAPDRLFACKALDTRWDAGQTIAPPHKEPGR